jgi:hypothetical protein
MTEFTPASRVSRIKSSASVAAAARVRELKAEGRRILDLTVGEPDFDTPDHIKDAGVAGDRPMGDQVHVSHWNAGLAEGDPADSRGVAGRRAGGQRGQGSRRGHGRPQQEVTSGRLQCAIDVMDPEPLPGDHPLWASPNALITPDVGGNASAFEPRIGS